jgi:hypothetical protein
MGSIDDLDHIFASFIGSLPNASPLIACLYTGVIRPSNCSPMLRSPLPHAGQPLDASFSSSFASAISLNPTVHDGAVMFQREDALSVYRVSSWSYRLFPPDGRGRTLANRGSAFNSCLAMSEVQGIDRLYIVNLDYAFRFENGEFSQFFTS